MTNRARVDQTQLKKFQEVRDVIHKMKSSDKDNISSELLKLCEAELCLPAMNIIIILSITRRFRSQVKNILSLSGTLTGKES